VTFTGSVIDSSRILILVNINTQLEDDRNIRVDSLEASVTNDMYCNNNAALMYCSNNTAFDFWFAWTVSSESIQVSRVAQNELL